MNEYKLQTKQGFPAGSVVKKNPPAKAGDTRSLPDPGRWYMAHGSRQLSPCATTAVPELQSLRAAAAEACTPKRPSSVAREATATRGAATREWPPLAASREKPAQHSSEDQAQP